MSRKILIMAAVALFCFDGLVLAQNSNSSTTTMKPTVNSSHSMHGRRRGRRRHARRRGRRTANKNANTQ